MTVEFQLKHDGSSKTVVNVGNLLKYSYFSIAE